MNESESHSVVSNFLWPHGLYRPWNSPSQNTEVGSQSLLQGIFPTHGSNPGIPHCRQILYQLNHQGRKLLSSTDIKDKYNNQYNIAIKFYRKQPKESKKKKCLMKRKKFNSSLWSNIKNCSFAVPLKIVSSSAGGTGLTFVGEKTELNR